MPAHVRRAPRFGRVIGTGVAVGFVIGAGCGLVLPNSTGVGRGMVAILVGLGFALIGGVVTGMIAAGLDRGTPRYLKNAPTAAWPPADASDSRESRTDPASASADGNADAVDDPAAERP